MMRQISAAILAVFMTAAIGSSPSVAAGDNAGIAGFGGVYVNEAVINRLDQKGDLNIFRIALNRAYHRQFGAESLIGRRPQFGLAYPANWHADEAELDRTIDDVARLLAAQNAGR